MQRTKGFSLIELLIVVAIILILAAIAIPKMLEARISANEASAVSSIRTITNAQVVYRITYGAYAEDLAALHSEGTIDGQLGGAPYQKSGYSFSSTGDSEGFTTNTKPLNSGITGRRSFCTSTPAFINYSPEGEDCIPNSSPVLQ